MLGDTLVYIVFILAMIGLVSVFFKSFIPGAIDGFLVVLKALLYLATLPFVIFFSMLSLIYERRNSIVGFVTKTFTHTRSYVDSRGAVRTHVDTVQDRVPVRKKDIFNKSGRF